MTPQANDDTMISSRRMALLHARTVSPPRDLEFAAAAETSRTAAAVEISPAEGRRYFGVAEGALVSVADASAAVFAVRAVRWNFGIALALVSFHKGLLIDGLAALRFSLLDIRSTLIVPGLDAFFYVTEKIKPYLGPPPREILGRECPICKIPFATDTRVGGCRCGQFFHFETPESHPDVADEDRLDCFQRAGVCRCGGVLTTAEQLLWNIDQP